VLCNLQFTATIKPRTEFHGAELVYWGGTIELQYIFIFKSSPQAACEDYIVQAGPPRIYSDPPREPFEPHSLFLLLISEVMIHRQLYKLHQNISYFTDHLWTPEHFCILWTIEIMSSSVRIRIRLDHLLWQILIRTLLIILTKCQHNLCWTKWIFLWTLGHYVCFQNKFDADVWIYFEVLYSFWIF